MKRTRETFVHLIAKSCCVSALTLGTLCLPTLTHAQTSVATAPEGYITLNIAPGTGTSYITTPVSLPLHRPLQGSGQLTGVITGVTANTITNANAGWTAGSFSVAANPFAIKITSGAATGRVLVISNATANTATTATVDNQGTDLTTLGIVAGTDTYEVLPVDTLLSVFGTPATTDVQGGPNQTTADQIVVFNQGWIAYYYNTTNSRWQRVTPPVPADNVVIRPDQGILYSRIANRALTFTLLGRVPNTTAKIAVNNGGITLLGSTWPANTTLATSAIKDIPGWVASTDYNVADQVQIYSSSGWKSFYYNGTNWRRTTPPVVSDTEPITAGSIVLLYKRGSATGVQVLTQTMPYNLN